jgi:magnesium-transporting ATPase (P-type)
VDVACTDKTGTLTEGRLVLRLVTDACHARQLSIPSPEPLPEHLALVLETAALASPSPDSVHGVTHPTDRAVLAAAAEAGLAASLRLPRLREAPFDSARAFHASLLEDRLCVKGAPERLLPRCSFVLGPDGDTGPLDQAGRQRLLDRVAALAASGLRILMAAQGPAPADPEDPRNLTALGFLGISDPLRPTVPQAVRRCLAAGIRVLMLTGDHPATGRAIAAEAGLFDAGHDGVMRAAELSELSGEALTRRLEGVAVIARATPLDKLRIVEALRQRGHTVAMTGDGVNDAPSLRLADVGVAMGRTGTEVARQASDLVLIDDDFATLVEALVEGRGFWKNMRAGLGLLLGGNAGEMGVIVIANLLGYGSPLTSAQILLVNLITDALPALAVLLQRPEHRNLAGLAREGLHALDVGLRRDVVRRAISTAVPSLAAYLYSHATSGPAAAGAVAFTGVVATQLAQTLDAGRVEGSISGSVAGAVSASVAGLVASVTVPPVRDFFGLISPTPLGWGVVMGAAAGAVAMNRTISWLENRAQGLPGPESSAQPEPAFDG